ncbi:MAG: hypothetical protein BMS9Abin01_0279 [Gammaproteobacteria bacterium]|nr:MAG: hypothetical protein BMS9Abin01_0279 [Gammaproteobacteria bacterium]
MVAMVETRERSAIAPGSPAGEPVNVIVDVVAQPAIGGPELDRYLAQTPDLVFDGVGWLLYLITPRVAAAPINWNVSRNSTDCNAVVLF